MIGDMKVLLVGSSGSIGGEVLRHCLAHPDITSIVSFTRRELPADGTATPKLTNVKIQDFSNWPEEILNVHKDAVAMIWAMGSWDGNIQVDVEYPLTFQRQFAEILKSSAPRPQFRYIHLSGMLTEQNQRKSLWFMNEPRKAKGKQETEAGEIAKEHEAIWRSFMVRPGGVLTKEMFARLCSGELLGKKWSVKIEELAAYMTYLAVQGDENDTIIDNASIVEKGNALLSARAVI